jgi:radical SAM protein with 4Fe4S-binding SPASM domain
VKLQNYPKRIVIELTPECNLSCVVCPRRSIEEKKGYISKNLFTKIIGQIVKYSPESVVIPFWRGESTLHPDFCELIELALKNSLHVHISTNGEAIDDDDLKLLVKCEFVNFSIHTISGYDTAKRSLDFRSGKYPIIQASFVEGESSMKDVYSAIVSSPDLAGFDSVRVYIRHSKDGVFGSIEKKTDAKRIFCPKLLDTLVIAYDGTVSRCNHIWETEKGINANDMSILEIWNSTYLEQIRKSYPDQRCEPCGQWAGHTCGERWQNENGKIQHSQFGSEN